MMEIQKKNWWKIGCLGLAGVLGFFVVLGAIVGESDTEATTETAQAVDASTEVDAGVAAVEAAPDPADSLTGPQRNALRSAESYLSMSGFSRDGLIEQLSSDAGDGYEVADATAAVDSLNADWNEQAARSAQDYLKMMGFSCDGLVEQLSSPAGDKYTAEQARFGAQQAGAC